MINEDGVVVPDPDPESLLAVREAKAMIADWQPDTATWPPIRQLVAEIEAKTNDQFGGPLTTPTLPTVRRATWEEIRKQLAAQQSKPAADPALSRVPKLMLPGAPMPGPSASQIRTEIIPATPEAREVVEAEIVAGAGPTEDPASPPPASWRQIQSPGKA
jgi:hypothetical protein